MGLALAVLAAGPAAAVGPAGRLPSSRPLVLVDAAGQVVGRVVEGSQPDRMTVWLRVAGRDLLLVADPDRLDTGAVLGLAVFESADCSGPARVYTFALPSLPAPLFPPAVAGPGAVLVVADGPAAPATIRSAWSPSADPPCQTVPATVLAVRPGLPVLDLDAFTPPFRVR